MNIRDIIIYSHAGEMRRISFKVTGLNIVTGRSSTGKSALSDIAEYCMGRSEFNIPEGPIRDKVSWYAVIYQFPGEQVLVAKPAPAPSAASCSRVMIRRGSTVEPPPFAELQQNADDETVVSLLSGLLKIPANRTQVDQDHSRDSFDATIKHAYYYLFQKQGLSRPTLASRRQHNPHPVVPPSTACAHPPTTSLAMPCIFVSSHRKASIVFLRIVVRRGRVEFPKRDNTQARDRFSPWK